MSEPKPVYNFVLQDRNGKVLDSGEIPKVEIRYDWNLQSFSEPPSSLSPKGLQELQLSKITMAFSVPPDLLRPYRGVIEEVAQQEIAFQEYANSLGILVKEMTQEQMEIAQIATGLLRASVMETTDTIYRLTEAMEQLRMKMIGRRYQAILAVLVVVVYLLVWMGTR
jgi:hypothetical protein